MGQIDLRAILQNSMQFLRTADTARVITMRISRADILFALLCVIWGGSWIAAKAGVSAVPPTIFAGTRFLCAGAILLAVLFMRGELTRIFPWDRWRFVAVTGLIIVATYTLLFWGAKFVSSGLAAILNLALIPVALLTIGALRGEDKVTPLKTLGISVGVLGLVILIGPKAFDGYGQNRSSELLGAGAIILSALVYSFGSVLARPLLRTYSPSMVAGLTMFVGGAVMIAGALLFENGAVTALAGHWGRAAWMGWIFLVFFGSLAGYTIFLYLIDVWGASRAGAYAFVSPAIAVLLGVVIFGEALQARDIVGMATMLAGTRLILD